MYIAQAGLKLSNPLPQLLKYWGQRYAIPGYQVGFLAVSYLIFETRCICSKGWSQTPDTLLMSPKYWDYKHAPKNVSKNLDTRKWKVAARRSSGVLDQPDMIPHLQSRGAEGQSKLKRRGLEMKLGGRLITNPLACMRDTVFNLNTTHNKFKLRVISELQSFKTNQNSVVHTHL